MASKATQVTKREQIKKSLIHKLHPSRLRVSGKFCALLGCLLDQKWTEPTIPSILITSDGFLLGHKDGGYNEFIGDASDLIRNINDVCDVVEATDDERAYLLARIESYRT